VRELLLEVRSFFHRIQMLCKERVWNEGVYVGPAFEFEPDASGFLPSCAETERRNLGIEKLESKYPWACSTDMVLFLSGFETAGEIPSCILDSEFEESFVSID